METIKGEKIEVPKEQEYFIPLYKIGDLWFLPFLTHPPETKEQAAKLFNGLNTDDAKIFKVKLPI